MERIVEEEYGHRLSRGQTVGEWVGESEEGKGSKAGGKRWTLLLLWWGLSPVVGACLPGAEGPPPPPEALLSFVGEAEVQIRPAAAGVAYYGIRSAGKPWGLHLLRVELNRCELGVKVLEAPVPEGEGRGRSRVTELLDQEAAGALAGVNGDFFTPEGLPVGTEVVGGSTRRVGSRPVFAWRPGDEPWIGMPEVEGDSVMVLGWRLSRIQGDGESQVIGGFPLLLREGLRVGDLEVGNRPSFAAERHPRTAVAFDSDEEVLWMVVVDGRQPDYSVGMTLPELTSLLEALGVEEAINLDGGGSSIMVLQGQMVSSPSDPDGERPVANALAILRDPTFCRVGP